MKNIFYTSCLLIILFASLFSCHKDVETNNKLNSVSIKFNDYIPLKAGAKYKYKYFEFHNIDLNQWITEADCLWDFISVSADSSVCQVKVTLNGYRVTVLDFRTSQQLQDTTLIKDEVTFERFEVQSDGV